MGNPPPTPPVPPPGYQYQYGHGPYDQWYGYGPPGVPADPQQGGPVTGDDTTWGLMCYLGTLIFGFLAPLVIYFARKNRSAFVRFHAAQALNYQITIFIQVMAPFLVAIPLAVVTNDPVWLVLVAPLAVFHMFAQWVFLILGTIRASQGRYHRFPVWTCFPMIK
ncbi:hypothetical protein SAMN04489712_107292 [Thermomonospora echinospora]|uniref:DUF4870 domain-containing protein n=1 Tax=Thermomonospora echinospora TaxID=1992 RepID=A0A1H6BNX1_9ACTN|nr:DUF4870 domain-containing protein [Thermomonospora echinospora]SEG62374.1 hypothetical protein SAMN04489712_107292 [Thermomonospora echinospora]